MSSLRLFKYLMNYLLKHRTLLIWPSSLSSDNIDSLHSRLLFSRIPDQQVHDCRNTSWAGNWSNDIANKGSRGHSEIVLHLKNKPSDAALEFLPHNFTRANPNKVSTYKDNYNAKINANEDKSQISTTHTKMLTLQ